MIIFDPISAFWGEVNENKNPQVRVVMEQLKRVAEDYQVAIVLVTHYNKGLGTQALARITGSLALAAACRSVWSVTNNKETNIRTVACVKMNLSENRAGFTFEISDGKINILEEHVDVSADDMLYERMLNNQKNRGPEPEKLNESCDWLQGFLASGAVWVAEVYEKAEAAGYKKRTIDRAKKLLNIKSKKEDFSGHWMWSFPSNFQNNSGTKNNLATFEDCQVISENSENLATFAQSLENKGFENEILKENCEDCQVSPVYTKNLAIFAENNLSNINSTVETNCENNGNNETKIPADSTITKDCGKTKKSPESSDMVVTTTVEEAQERVKRIVESKQDRLERINRQTEENLKKVKLAAGEK
jgi:hypothetical protein